MTKSTHDADVAFIRALAELLNENDLTELQVKREYGADEDTIIAAWLHDTVEDTDTTLDEITQLFGANVAGIVDEVTDDPTLELQHPSL